MPSGVQSLLVLAASLVVLWAIFLLFVAIVQPKGIDIGDAVRFVPDVVQLLRRMAADPTLSRAAKRKLRLLLVYLIFPIDLVPDFIPVLGYSDDLILIAIVLRSTIRTAGPKLIEQHWPGSPEGLALLHKLAGEKGKRET